MSYGRKIFTKILLIGFFLSLIAVYDTELGDLPYVILLFSMVVIFIGALLNIYIGRSIHFGLNFNDARFGPLDKICSKILVFIWLGIVISWGYGVVLGLLNQVPAEFVFRNFFGLLIYIICPVLFFLLPKRKDLIVTVILAGFVQVIYGVQAFLSIFKDPSLFIVQNSLSDSRSFYSTGLVIIFPLFATSLAHFMLPRKLFFNDYDSAIIDSTKKIYFLMIVAFALIVPAMSKGFILAVFMLIVYLILISIFYLFKTGTITKVSIFALILLSSLFAYLFFNYFDLIVYSFSSDEISNAKRSEQYNYLISDLSLAGHGLGAPLSSGFSRDASGYGMELTYLNIIHKLGVFSVFLFSSYLLTIFVATIRIVRGIYVFESVFVLGSMGYLVVGAGNPILLSTVGVTLHSIGMYLLVSPFLKQLR